MTKLLTLTILTVFFGFRMTKTLYIDSGLDDYRAYVQETRKDVKSKVKEFQNENIRMMINIGNFLGFTKKLTESAFQEDLSEALNNTRDSVEVSMAQGKNSEHCLVEAAQKFEQLKKDMVNKLVACASKIETQPTPEWDFVHSFTKEAENVLHQLNRVFAACFSHFGPAEGCVAIGVERVKPIVSSFNNNYERTFESRETLIEKARKNALKCFNEHQENQKEQIEIVTKSAQSCVEKA